jgi:hypothetical protein
VPYKIKPLLELVSASIREDIIPAMLKKSVVKPIYKKGTKEGADNYSPVILVLALSKIMEK